MEIAPWESYKKCLKDSALSKRVQRNSGMEGTSLPFIVRKEGGEKQQRKRVQEKGGGVWREKTQVLPQTTEEAYLTYRVAIFAT